MERAWGQEEATHSAGREPQPEKEGRPHTAPGMAAWPTSAWHHPSTDTDSHGLTEPAHSRGPIWKLYLSLSPNNGGCQFQTPHVSSKLQWGMYSPYVSELLFSEALDWHLTKSGSFRSWLLNPQIIFKVNITNKFRHENPQGDTWTHLCSTAGIPTPRLHSFFSLHPKSWCETLKCECWPQGRTADTEGSKAPAAGQSKHQVISPSPGPPHRPSTLCMVCGLLARKAPANLSPQKPPPLLCLPMSGNSTKAELLQK